MEIIIEGRKVDTKDIWDIKFKSDAWQVSITVNVNGQPDIFIGRKVPWEISPMGMARIVSPYEELYKSIKQKWEADKSDLPVFKL